MRFLLCCCAHLLVLSAPAFALEAWTDERLSIQDGIALWLDGAAQNDARKTNRLLPLGAGDPIDVWFDGSGKKRDVSAAELAARPTVRLDEGLAFARFEGDSQSLSNDELETSFEEVSIFVVAAPISNDGAYAALLGVNRAGQQDYTSGLNIDLGPYPSTAFDTVNVEGAGAVGVRDLKNSTSAFQQFQRLCLISRVGKDGIALYVNGVREGARDRADSTIQADQIAIGARRFGVPPEIRGFFTGEIAEIIIYNRVLDDDERNQVDQYLAKKYEHAGEVPPLPVSPGAKPLAQVDNPPPVQMYVPGFSARELPIELPNINNVLYRADGKLVALGYNGNVYLLSDSDGDGLEDDAKLFWENVGTIRSPIGMDLTPPSDPRGAGVLITSKTKCLLVLDSDDDGKADRVIDVADGWVETPHGVDALGMAVDPRDGSVYFGIGTHNFVNGYLLDGEGKSQYRLDGDRGTIQRVAPDFKSREIVATGIRFPVAIRFNRAGDLFCTDQEGATWLPNGNPLDELLHIDFKRTRHYGFPPRHPLHLPGVIDEPSVYDYRPQHQSTCGLNFNENVHGWPTFGPDWWEGDAIVTGYSRGKLYRTKLVKTGTGYVAQNQSIGIVQALPADACIGPTGELVVATHSGGPDWGSGPSGTGKLFKIQRTADDAPAPVAVWARTPTEVRIAFDRKLNAEEVATWRSRMTIDYGQAVAAGDRFERIRPGYAVVVQQMKSPRYDLDVLDVGLTNDRRTVVISTAPHKAALNYSITLPAPESVATAALPGEIPHLAEIDLEYDLTGVEAIWQPDAVELPWRGWLPHLDLTVSRDLTKHSGDHQELWRRTDEPGTLILRTQLRLHEMLRPLVQPGSKVDFTYPPEQTTVVLESDRPMEVRLGGKAVSVATTERGSRAEFSVNSSDEEPGQLEVVLNVADEQPRLTAHYFTNEDSTPRALSLRRFTMPWAPITDEPVLVVDNSELPELQDGNWLRGKHLFFGEQAMCSRCHKVRGEGGSIGPDLSNLPQRDHESVLRDITRPSFAINPDYLAHSILLSDGRVLTGVPRSEGDELVIGHQDGQEVRVSTEEIEDIEAAPLSVMPEGIAEQLGPEKLRDLLTFLLVEPPHLTDYGPLAPPPPRGLSEVKAVIAGAPDSVEKRSVNVVLVSGRKDHGPGEHDYPAWQTMWARLLAMDDATTLGTASDWPTREQLATADVLVFYQQGTWNGDRARDIDAFLERGGGLVYIHYAVDGGQDAPGFAERIGLAWKGGHSKFRHGTLDIDFSPGVEHPISRNFDLVHFHDESYWNLLGDPRAISLVGQGVEEGAPQPLFWTTTRGDGRVFVSIPGHFSWTFDDPLFRILLLRGIAWAADEPVDRFNELVLPGARVRQQ